jgi:hypothetical protein
MTTITARAIRRRSMNNTTRAAIVHALLLPALAAAACADRGSVTAPTPTPSVGVTADISIGGVVYDTAHRLLGGATVEVIEGAVEGYWCHSGVQPPPVCIVATVADGSGRFLFSGHFGSVTRLRASMEGYLAATLTVDSTTSNSAIEFRLEPSVAP